MTSVLVTGANGFVGRALCAQLQSHGHDVLGATRTPVGDLPCAAVQIGDIGADADWRAGLAGREAVIHLAAHVHVMSGRPGAMAVDFDRVNVAGSEHLARAAARTGVRRFVFLSSVKVNGETSAGRAFVEGDPAAPADAYARSKADAERRLTTIAAETGMELVIVRLPLVYGPGVKANFLELLRAVDAGLPLPFASIDNRRSLVYLGNLVDALEACMSHPAAADRTFFVSDGQDVSTPQLVREIAAALGKRPLLLPLPPSLLRGVGKLLGRAEQIDRLTGSLQVDIGAIQAALGWAPPFPLREGLAQTVAWYRSRFG
jgi:nucleoside-diphosphate-sugar epimerase